jgi:ADP-heptose:LPS heptosyltransferase
MRNILVVRNDRFGEFLLIIPALRALKEKYPQASITLAVDTYVADLANAVEGVNDVIIWKNRKHSFKETLAFSRQIRGRGFDLAVIFNPSRDSNLACFLAKIPTRVGYNRKWGFLLTHKISDRKQLALKHEVEYNLDLVALVGAFTDDKSLRLKIVRTGFLDALKGSYVVAIHPWTSDPVKQWPLERFKELIRRLSGLEIVIIGGQEELAKNKDFFNGLDELAINLTGKTNLFELAGVLKKVSLLVSGDSGPVHLAAAVGTPTVVLFRNDLPGKTAKRWGPWGARHTVIEKSKLEDISVDEVIKVIKNKLNSREVPIGE